MEIKLPIGYNLYRARKDITDNVTGNWFTLDSQSAKIYGKFVGKYTVKKELRCINLLSNTFHKDFMDKLTIEYQGKNKDGIDVQKLLYLVPIGMPDLTLQNIIAKKLNIQDQQLIPNNDSMFMSYWKTLNNISRFSEYSLDTEFANKIKEIYGKEFDGFILPLKCPSVPYGGFFHPEIYINDNSFIEYLSDLNVSMNGGSEKIKENTIFPLRHFRNREHLDSFIQELQKESDKISANINIFSKKRNFTRKNSRNK